MSDKIEPTSDLANLEELLDDLYSLHDNLLSKAADKASSKTNLTLPGSLSEDHANSIEIPIPSDVVDREIDEERKLLEQFNQAQQHLFDQHSAPQTANDTQIDAIVNKLMNKIRPRVDQLLRDKIRTMVRERFNRQDQSNRDS